MKFADKEIRLRRLHSILLAIGYLKERLLRGEGGFFDWFVLFLLLDLPKVVHTIGTLYYYGLTSFRKRGGMGCCARSPLAAPGKQFEEREVNSHFIAVMQIEYLRKRLPDTEQNMLEHSQRIRRERLSEIEKKQQVMEGRFQEKIQLARADPIKARELEIKHNMSLEEIVGLQAHRRKFQELKNIVAANFKKVEEQMVADVRLMFELMESKLKERTINLEIKQVTHQDLSILERDFRERKAQEIKRAEEQVEEQIDKRVSFDNFTKRFVSVVPFEELMGLTDQSYIKQQLPQSLAQTQQAQVRPCCC